MKLYMSIKSVLFTISGICLSVLLLMGVSLYHQINDVSYYSDIIQYLARIGQDVLVRHTIAELLLDALILFTICRNSWRIYKQWFLTRKWRQYFSQRIHWEKTYLYNRKYRRWNTEIVIIRDPTFVAITMGLLQPKIILSTGALELLNQSEQRAVILHEVYHCQGKDTLKHFLIYLVEYGLMYIPVIKQLAEYYRARTEILADRFSIDQTGASSGLSSALLKVLRTQNNGQLAKVGINFTESAINYRIMQLLDLDNPVRIPVKVHWKPMVYSILVMLSILLVVTVNCTT
ncbi:M56 family metallopeptidase [Paenibacillus sp. GYB004]|uniref:M56 family metallopeptidase n=1 Tax=Paenibacillus sp. GYB004 TaxID=2994393 RepID=UPI002F96C7D0